MSKKDHHAERGGLANASKRTDRRWLAKRTNGMTTIHPATERSAGSYSPTKDSVLQCESRCQAKGFTILFGSIIILNS